MTISLDEATYRSARIAAAERGISASALVRDWLTQLRPAKQDKDLEALIATFNLANPGFSATDRYNREQVNDRAFQRAEHEAAMRRRAENTGV